jgi:PKD repeat protein
MKLRLIAILLLISLSLSLTPTRAGSPHTLSYVESSDGLEPPYWEGGHTEFDMGDVNADGNLDIVSIGDHGSPLYDYYGIMVWLGDGAGNWERVMSGEFGYGGVALGDVNGDGFIDIGYGMHHNYSGNDFGDQILEIALGDGTGQNWTPWDDGLAGNGEDWGMFGSDFADVDNDGDLDLGSISFGCCAGVHVYLNQGDGSWEQSFGFLDGNSNMQFDFGDVNGDGNADFAVAHSFGLVYFGDGMGDFELADGNLPSSYGSIALGDVTGDGRDELGLVSDSGGVEVWQWLSPGSWQEISSGLPSSGTYEAVQLFDMDMDGWRDVAAFGESQGRVWTGDGAGNWTEAASFTTPTPGYMQAFRAGGDADHNGYPDIVLLSDEGNWWNSQNHMHFYKEASTPESLQVKPVFPSGWETFHAGSVAFVDWVSAVPSGDAATVTLELSVHGPGGPWQTLAAGLPDSGRYQWLIPAGTPSTDGAFIRYTLTVEAETVQALTPAAFNILGSFTEPIVGLQATNDSPTVLGEATILTATVVSGTNVLYEWALGDGLTTTGAVVSHVYTGLGVYTAVVTASNAISFDVATTSVEIYEETIRGLSVINDSPTVLGEPTLLSASVLSGTNVVFDWILGDGTFATGDQVSHVYPDLGTYTAVVTASNSLGWASADTVVEVYEEPISGLSATDDSPTVLGEPTILTASVLAGTNVVYEWRLGDGAIASSEMVSHTYPYAGVYTAVVTATNAVSWQAATTIVLVEAPIGGLAALNDGPTPLGITTTLSATLEGGTNVTYTWDLGDGTLAKGATIEHIYPAAGVYTAVVTATNSVGWEVATTTVVVVAHPKPVYYYFLPITWLGMRTPYANFSR